MRIRLLLASAFVFLAGSAGAVDVAPAIEQLSGGCVKVKLCDAEADAGVTTPCKNTAGNANIVDNLAGRFAMTAYSTSSTATTYTCNLMTSDNGFQATKRTALTSAATSTNLSYADTRFSVSISGTFADIWAECDTAIAGGTVTINLYACPLTR